MTSFANHIRLRLQGLCLFNSGRCWCSQVSTVLEACRCTRMCEWYGLQTLLDSLSACVIQQPQTRVLFGQVIHPAFASRALLECFVRQPLSPGVRSYFANASAGSSNISVPAETAMENFTHWRLGLCSVQSRPCDLLAFPFWFMFMQGFKR